MTELAGKAAYTPSPDAAPSQREARLLGTLDRFETHSLKVVPPYLDALKDGGKTFEVRKNDRAYQRGDLLILNEWHPARLGDPSCHRCVNLGWDGHYTGRKAVRWITFVYSGDARFGGIEPGFVVLGIGSDDYTEGSERV